jgi:hypothetical protein
MQKEKDKKVQKDLSSFKVHTRFNELCAQFYLQTTNLAVKYHRMQIITEILHLNKQNTETLCFLLLL